jgi:hypothetical protein
MPAKYIPEGFHSVTPYLTCTNVGEVIDFLKQTFDAKEIERMLQLPIVGLPWWLREPERGPAAPGNDEGAPAGSRSNRSFRCDLDLS